MYYVIEAQSVSVRMRKGEQNLVCFHFLRKKIEAIYRFFFPLFPSAIVVDL